MTFPASRVGFAVHHARAGERILMVVPDLGVAAQVLTMVHHFRIQEGERLLRSLGAQGFETPAGGWIRFVGQRTIASSREGGLTADRVLVDPDVPISGRVLQACQLIAGRITR